jgi:hypothetical protein
MSELIFCEKLAGTGHEASGKKHVCQDWAAVELLILSYLYGMRIGLRQYQNV